MQRGARESECIEEEGGGGSEGARAREREREEEQRRDGVKEARKRGSVEGG
jgi:hypothetical protein